MAHFYFMSGQSLSAKIGNDEILFNPDFDLKKDESSRKKYRFKRKSTTFSDKGRHCTTASYKCLTGSLANLILLSK